MQFSKSQLQTIRQASARVFGQILDNEAGGLTIRKELRKNRLAVYARQFPKFNPSRLPHELDDRKLYWEEMNKMKVLMKAAKAKNTYQTPKK